MFTVETRAWYWTPDNELRECIILTVWDEQTVIDAITEEEINVKPEDTMIEKPD